MLKGIVFARAARLALSGNCAGFQYVSSSSRRHVLNIADADSAENIPGRRHHYLPVHARNFTSRGNTRKLSGAVPEIRLCPGSSCSPFYGKDKDTVTEDSSATLN